jgi:hypothetical protein
MVRTKRVTTTSCHRVTDANNAMVIPETKAEIDLRFMTCFLRERRYPAVSSHRYTREKSTFWEKKMTESVKRVEIKGCCF